MKTLRRGASFQNFLRRWQTWLLWSMRSSTYTHWFKGISLFLLISWTTADTPPAHCSLLPSAHLALATLLYLYNCKGFRFKIVTPCFSPHLYQTLSIVKIAKPQSSFIYNSLTNKHPGVLANFNLGKVPSWLVFCLYVYFFKKRILLTDLKSRESEQEREKFFHLLVHSLYGHIGWSLEPSFTQSPMWVAGEQVLSSQDHWQGTISAVQQSGLEPVLWHGTWAWQAAA